MNETSHEKYREGERSYHRTPDNDASDVLSPQLGSENVRRFFRICGQSTPSTYAILGTRYSVCTMWLTHFNLILCLVQPWDRPTDAFPIFYLYLLTPPSTSPSRAPSDCCRLPSHKIAPNMTLWWKKYGKEKGIDEMSLTGCSYPALAMLQ